MNESSAPKHPLRRPWVWPAVAACVPILFGLIRALILLFTNLDTEGDEPVLILLSAGGVVVVGALVVGFAIPVTRRIYDRAVWVWLRRQAPDEVRRHFAEHFDDDVVELCYNPLCTAHSMLSIERVVAEYFHIAGSTAKGLLSAHRTNLLVDTAASLRYWAQQEQDAKRLVSTLGVLFQNEPLSQLIEVLPDWPVTPEGMTYKQLPREAARIALEYRLQVYNSLNSDPRTDSEARQAIQKAGRGVVEVCLMLDALVENTERLKSLAKDSVRMIRGNVLLYRKSCMPPNMSRHDVRSTL